MDKVNIREKLSLFDEMWVPKVVGEINDSYVKVVKAKGEYNWHFHECIIVHTEITEQEYKLELIK